MVMVEPSFEWAAAWVVHPTPFVLGHTVRTTRVEVLKFMGATWARDGETWRQGWRRAYREGCRAIRVKVSKT